jgi:hypothetical protein
MGATSCLNVRRACRGDVNSYSGGGENTRFVSYNKFHEPTSDLFAPLSTQVSPCGTSVVTGPGPRPVV